MGLSYWDHHMYIFLLLSRIRCIHYLMYIFLLSLSYVRFLSTLCGIIYVHFLITLAYADGFILITIAYTQPTLYCVHFLIDRILCTLSYNSMWVMWDYLIYIFLLTVSYWPYLIDIVLLLALDYLINRILSTFSGYFRVRFSSIR